MSIALDDSVAALNTIRNATGTARTRGVSDEWLRDRLPNDPLLRKAIAEAQAEFERLPGADRELLQLPEEEACGQARGQIVNFYPAEGINPYLPLAARGPWIISAYGAVIHDDGGYGMLGMGHNPEEILESLGRPMVMANVMTPSLAQRRLCALLQREIGHRRGSCPLPRYAFLNSGSEAVSLTARYVDLHAGRLTAPGAQRSGSEIRTLALEAGFHGRTERPAELSQSTRKAYRTHLASFRQDPPIDFVPINDATALEGAFARAHDRGIWYQAVYIEPVMGEGLPGLAVTREYYDKVRRLSRENDTLLVVDSIQAALRAQGCLSIVDYPGFEDCEAPDMETFSKALNAGQYPLSIVALSDEAAALYVTGVYGNTMTANPKALTVACHVLSSLDAERREHIRWSGLHLRQGFEQLAEQQDGILRVDGTGLMVCAHLDPALYRVEGRGGFEEYLRVHGIEMIHGGSNGLRFTPHFAIDEQEIDLILSTVRRGLEEMRLA